MTLAESDAHPIPRSTNELRPRQREVDGLLLTLAQSLARLTNCARASARILGHLGGPGETA
ncbi:MAG: hypothetical protein ACM3ZE_24325, partial [Myxococcales bacterium]